MLGLDWTILLTMAVVLASAGLMRPFRRCAIPCGAEGEGLLESLLLREKGRFTCEDNAAVSTRVESLLAEVNGDVWTVVAEDENDEEAGGEEGEEPWAEELEFVHCLGPFGEGRRGSR